MKKTDRKIGINEIKHIHLIRHIYFENLTFKEMKNEIFMKSLHWPKKIIDYKITKMDKAFQVYHHMRYNISIKIYDVIDDIEKWKKKDEKIEKND